VVDDLEPGQERLVELRQGGNGGMLKLRQEVGLDELEEAFDLAAAFGVVGGAQDTLDPEGRTDGVEMVGDMDLGQVDVDGERAALAEDSAFETVLHTGELLVPVELRVRDEAGVVVEEGEQKHLTFLARVGGVGDVWAMHGIALPEVAEVVSFKAAVGLGPLLVEELSRGSVASSQMSTQSAWGNTFLGDGVGLIEGQHRDDGAGRAVGLLTFKGLSAVEGLLRDNAGLTTIGAGLGFESIEPAFAVEPLPAGQRGRTDGGARRMGDVVLSAGDLLAQPLFPSGRIVVPQEGQDERVPEQRDFGASVFGLGHFSASFG